jgi:hypothetical protein
MPTFLDSSDDEYNIGPPLDVLVADKVMERINDMKLQEMMEKIMTAERERAEKFQERIMTAERERADKRLARLTTALFVMTIALIVVGIALVVVGYVVYTMPVKIVINVPNAAGGQCPVVDDWMHDFNAFEEPPAGETLETEHHMFQDLFQQASVLGVSVIKSKHFATFLGAGGPLAVGGAVFTTVFLTFIGY